MNEKPVATVTVSSRADLLALVPHVLGFQPQNSLVILGLGAGSPTARLDMPRTEEERRLTAETLAPAVKHWSQVAVVGYTDDTEAWEALSIPALLPGVGVAAVFRQRPEEVVPEFSGDLSRLACQHPAPNREALRAEAQKVTDPKTAADAAWRAYRAGDGASAWCYSDRATALGEDMADLNARLIGAVPPNAEVSA